VTRDEMTNSSRCRFGYWTLDDMVTKIDNLGARVRATKPLHMEMGYGDHHWHVDGKTCHLSYCVKVPHPTPIVAL
jgi:hypothetical protein